MKTVTISASKFRTECLKLMDEVQETKMHIIVTKRGVPIVEIRPAKKEKNRSSFGWMKGTGHIIGDIIAPTGEVWDAELEKLEKHKIVFDTYEMCATRGGN